MSEVFLDKHVTLGHRGVDKQKEDAHCKEVDDFLNDHYEWKYLEEDVDVKEPTEEESAEEEPVEEGGSRIVDPSMEELREKRI
jgi:hypothetical protein